MSGSLSAGVDGGFDLKGELQGGHSSLRFWPEESVQFQNDEMKGTLGSSGQRSRSSLRRWHENTEQVHEGVSGQRSRSLLRRWQENTVPFHEPVTKGEMFWSRRRRRRGGGLAETRSGRVLDVSHIFDLSSVRVESPLSRVQRVTAALHGHHNACGTHISQNSYSVHDACGVWNSENSRGDTVAGGQRFCVQGGTQLLSTSTRTRVRRSAVYESAHTQQAPLKLHVETREGLFRNHKIFRELDILPGCAVRVACPSCPDYSPEPPGPGRIIRNMLGWSLLQETEESGVWIFRGALQGENFFLSLTQLETGKGRGRTAQRGRSPVIPHALVHMRMGMVPLSGHTLESGAGHC